MIRILERLELYRDPRFYSSFPAVQCLPDGDCLLVFRRARDVRWLLDPTRRGTCPRRPEQVDHVDARSQLVSLRLDPRLQSKAPPRPLPMDPEVADQDASLYLDISSRLHLASFSYYPFPSPLTEAVDAWNGPQLNRPEGTGERFLLWGGWHTSSDDEGANWNGRHYLPRIPGEYPDGQERPPNRTAVRGAPAELDGQLFWAGYGGNAAPPAPRSARLYIVEPEGWRFQTHIAQNTGDVGFHEPALYATASGRLIAFLRTSGLEDRLVTACSEDQGKSWQPWRAHDLVGHPFHPCRLPDGRVLLTYGYRHQPYGIRARILEPECRDIDQAKEIVIRDDGPHGDLGYPWATVLDDKRVLVTYYFTAPDSTRHIAGSLLEIP